MIIEDKYTTSWHPAYDDLCELAKDWPYECDDIFEGKDKYPMYYFRYGKGPRRLVIAGRVHGHEPAGTTGTIAFLKSLADLSEKDESTWYNNLTIDVIPMVNVDAAIRYAQLVPDSYPQNAFKETENDFENFINIMTSPGRALFNNLSMRVHHLESATLKEMKVKDIPLGTLYNDEGIEPARDWTEQKSKHIKALLKFLQKEKTEYFINIHCHERPTEIYIPFTDEQDVQIQELSNYGKKLTEILRKQNIPCTTKKECSHYHVKGISINYLYAHLGIKGFLWEVNSGYKFPPSFKDILKEDYNQPSLTKSEMTKTVCTLLTNFLEQI